MTTTAYFDNQIFTDNRINQICDLIFQKLVQRFPPVAPDLKNDFVYEHFILSGQAAETLQEPKITPIKNIIFQTDNLEIYNFLVQNYKTILNAAGIVFKERILLYPLEFFFEIWYTPNDLDVLQSNGIIVQNIESISPIML